jgi:hypothetical protein
MSKSANLQSLEPPKTGWLIGGCHGTCFFFDSDGEVGRRSQRQFLFGNCIVLTLCAAIVAFVVALVWA